jgi:branched-subunit amino acid transport protein
MTYWEVWVAILGLTGVTFLTRTFFMLLGAKIPLSDSLQRAIRYAPAAALVAIIVPEILPFDPLAPMQTFDPFSPKMWGGIVGVIVFLISRSVLPTIFAGLLIFSLLRLYH